MYHLFLYSFYSFLYVDLINISFYKLLDLIAANTALSSSVSLTWVVAWVVSWISWVVFSAPLGDILQHILCIAIKIDAKYDLHITELRLTQSIFPYGFHQLRNTAPHASVKFIYENAWASVRFRILEYPSFILSSVTPGIRSPEEGISNLPQSFYYTIYYTISAKNYTI